MKQGKDKCELLKAIRIYVAKKYDLEYMPRECPHEGNCPGTCPLCDAELAALQQQLEEKGITDIAQDETLSKMAEAFSGNSQKHVTDMGGICLEGDTAEDVENINPEMPVTDERTVDFEGLPEIREESLYDRKVILECPVAGIMYHDIHEIWDDLYVGAEVVLVRDSKNSHDKNAVAVAFPASCYDKPDDIFFILGYIPRKDNAAIATLLDMGYGEMIKAEISDMKEHVSYSDRLHITVYLRSKHPIPPKDDRLFILEHDEAEWTMLMGELMEKGYTYRRWGKYLPDVRQLPVPGDRVVFICQKAQSSFLCLMMVVAEGEDCRKFLTLDEENDFCDDCQPYVLTLIKGDVKIPNRKLPDLGDEWKGRCRPECRLDMDISNQLLEKMNITRQR